MVLHDDDTTQLTRPLRNIPRVWRGVSTCSVRAFVVGRLLL